MQDLGRENLYKNGADNRDYGKKRDRRACGIRSLVLSPLTDMLPYDYSRAHGKAHQAKDDDVHGDAAGPNAREARCVAEHAYDKYVRCAVGCLEKQCPEDRDHEVQQTMNHRSVKKVSLGHLSYHLK